MEREVNETLATFLSRIEETDTLFENGIMLGRNVSIPQLFDGVENKVKKTPIAWPLVSYGLFYIVDVPEETLIAPHHHEEEDIFRILISGDLEINGIKIQQGEWFVVQKGTTYSIKTDSGYKALSAYTSICRTNRMTAMHLERSMSR